MLNKPVQLAIDPTQVLLANFFDLFLDPNNIKFFTAMSDPNVLLNMTIEKTKLIEALIVQFLGHKPSWKERKSFSILNKLGESSVYFKGKHIGTVTYEPVEETII